VENPAQTMSRYGYRYRREVVPIEVVMIIGTRIVLSLVERIDFVLRDDYRA